MNFAALTKELPPEGAFGLQDDYIAVLLENGKVTSARAPCSPTNLRFIAKFPGDWRWGKLGEVLAAEPVSNTEQLRNLQQLVAAQRSTLDLVLERARQIVDITRRNEG